MKRKLSLVLALLTLFTSLSFVSCGDKDTDTTAPTSGVASENDLAPEYTPELSDTNWGNKEFNMLTNSGFWSEEFDRETSSDDPVSTAIYERNRAIEAKYGIVINEIQSENPNDVIKNAFKSGENSYHCVALCAYQGAPLASDNIFQDLTDIENLDLEKHYWDQAAISDLSIDNKIFYATGDISVTANNGTFLMLYNKTLANTYGIEDDFVQMVNDRKWTVDYLTQLVSEYGYSDKSGDGAVGVDDVYGMGIQIEAYLGFYFGCGGKIVTKDDADMPSLSLSTKNNINIIDKINKLTKNGDNVIDAHEWLNADGTVPGDQFASVKAFIEGRSLFLVTNAGNMQDLRDMKDDFVVLPFPLLSENQSTYYSYVYHGANLISIPVMNKDDAAFTGFVLEALAAESYQRVTPAYYEKTLKSKYQRDERSYDMLDIVFRNRIWDLGYVCGFSGIDNSLITQIKAGSGSFASFYNRNHKKVTKAINEYIEAYEKSDNSK